ncbi:MAG: glucose-1-phosphate thymidylyltransferase [Nitrosopumilaceae archaeon]
MKGIILHGGYGTRLRPLTHTGPKQLLQIANKPMSQYALEDLRETGISEIAIIIGDIYPEKVKEYYGNGEQFGVKITYIYQEKPRGISHAIGLCKDFIGKDKFVVYLGDNVLRKDLVDYVNKFQKSQAEAMILLCEVENPQMFGVAEIKENKLVRITEKPMNPQSNFAVIGIYFLTPKIFDIIKELKPSWRGELEIADAFQLLLEKGRLIDYDIVTGWWKDTGTPDDILHANQLILDSIGTEYQFLLDDESTVKGNVVIGKDVIISKDSVIQGPSIIGHGCFIGPAARIGPHVSIGDNSTIKQCIIENSIIMSDCRIDVKIHIVDSIIAHGSNITTNLEKNKQKFLLGERSEIDL